MLMAGPIDCRINPTEVNRLATDKPIEWFEKNLIGIVPLRYKGALRKVSPGFLQISAFMSMNLDRRKESFRKMYAHYPAGETASARSASPWPPTTCAASWRRTASSTTCRQSSAITACSTASAGNGRSTRGCGISFMRSMSEGEASYKSSIPARISSALTCAASRAAGLILASWR